MDYWSYLKKDKGLDIIQPNFSSFPMTNIKKYIRREGQIWILSEAYIGRLDLASYDIYGTPDYWWVLLAVNDIMDPWDPNLMGMEIFCPDVRDIHDFIIDLKQHKAVGSENNG